MAARKKVGRKTKKKGTWGGARAGAGRPIGSGKGPSANSRRNRIAVQFSDNDLLILRRARKGTGKNRESVSTVAYRLLAQRLKFAKRKLGIRGAVQS